MDSICLSSGFSYEELKRLLSSKSKIFILPSFSEFCSLQGHIYLHIRMDIFIFLKLNKYAFPNFLFTFKN